MAIDIKTKEVNTIPVIGKYTVPVIKSVSVLLQNIPKNKKDCTGLFQLYWPVSVHTDWYCRFGWYNKKKLKIMKLTPLIKSTTPNPNHTKSTQNTLKFLWREKLKIGQTLSAYSIKWSNNKNSCSTNHLQNSSELSNDYAPKPPVLANN